MRAAVKQVLQEGRQGHGFHQFIVAIMTQAEVLYHDWPLVA